MIKYFKRILHKFGLHPWKTLDALLTYPRYLGIIKPKLLECAPQEYLALLTAMQRGWQAQTIDPPIGKKILAISPHPDDETIGAGGLLLAHRNVADIHLLAVFNGEYGGSDTSELSRKRLATRRKEEFFRIGERLGAKTCKTLDYSDGSFPLSVENAERLRSLVEEIEPDIVLLPWFLDHLPDHRVTNVLYAWGCKDYRCKIFAYEIWTLLHPNVVFDITNYLDEKIALFKQYESQLETIDYVGYIKGLAAVRAFHHSLAKKKSGGVEAFLTLPSGDYCELVEKLYGKKGIINKEIKPFLMAT